jgi:Zn finger protein HypA/HybF involved in hydrogenase expression
VPLAWSRGPGERVAVVDETVVDCPSCSEPFAIEVDTSAEEQSHFVQCPTCHEDLEVFVRCHSGELLSTSVSVD